MKRIIGFLFISVLNLSYGFAQVKWFDNFESAQKNSIETGNLILIECYHPECQHCQELNKSLESPYLFNYLNLKFSSFKINLSDIKQVEFLDQKNIRLTNFPIFLIFDNQGNFINFIEPEASPATIRRQFEENQGFSCVDCDKNQNSTLKELVKCALYYKLKKDLPKSNMAINRLFSAMPEMDKPTQISWNLMKKLTLGTENELFKYWFSNKDAVFKFEKEGRELDPFAAVIQSQSRILLNRNTNILGSEMQDLRNNLSLITSDPKRQLSWLWEIELAYSLQEKNFDAVKAICEKMISFYPEATTYSFLFEKILERNYDNGIFPYFEEVKTKWISGLQNAEHIKKAYMISAKYYGFNGKKNECMGSIDKARSQGLNNNEALLLQETYCK